MKLLTALRTRPILDAMRLYNSKLNLTFNRYDFQFDDWAKASLTQKAVFVRSRGGSKTNDFVDWLIFHVLRTHEQWGWLSAKSGQLSQALTYVRQNPFVQYVKNMSGKYDVTLWTGKTIRFGIISTSNLGLRLDGIVYDEFEDLQPKQQTDVYPQMAGMMTHSPVHKEIYLGTLWIATLFNEYAELYPCVVRPWDTIPWLVAAGMIQDEIDAGITPGWTIDLQYRCIPSSPTGLVFPRLIVEDLGEIHHSQDMLFGIDFGATDHCVGLQFDGGDVYVLEEYEVVLEDFNGALDVLKGYTVEAESGGYNDSDRYAAKCTLMKQRLGARGVPVTNKWKGERVMRARGFKVHVDKVLTPGVYKDLKACVYGPDGLYLKDAVHPNHFLDAFLHAIGAQPGIVYGTSEQGDRYRFLKNKV